MATGPQDQPAIEPVILALLLTLEHKNPAVGVNEPAWYRLQPGLVTLSLLARKKVTGCMNLPEDIQCRLSWYEASRETCTGQGITRNSEDVLLRHGYQSWTRTYVLVWP